MYFPKKEHSYGELLLRVLKLILPPVLFVILLLLVLQVFADSGVLKSFVLPAPTTVFHSLGTDMALFSPHLVQTLKVAALGFALSVIVGVLFALLMYRFKAVYRIFYPLVLVSQTIPTMVI
ncbi:MAG: hypothetical protein PHR37_06960, partial [Eubacteriales bacterium]|nr:hypothetical protein [Eubacteriales bacterium]